MKYIIWFSWWTDSVFVAWSLKQAWHEVLLVNLKNTKEKNKCCSLPTELLKISTFLDIPLKVVDATEKFKKLVIENFIENYTKWNTPNPCINCNENVRFQMLEEIRKELGYDFISTGHYVEKIQVDNFFTFAIPNDLNKDQTYMLYRLLKYQNIVEHLDFPISKYKKDEVKKIINEQNIPINTETESQNICFIPDDDYPRFIKQNKNIQFPVWKILDTKWNYLGEHKWLINYTIWQRKWLNLQSNEKKFVIDINWKNNILVVWDNEELFQTKVNIDDLILMNYTWKIYWKIRYKAPLTEVVNIQNNEIEFKEPVRAVTKGQHVVLYWKKDWKTFVIWWWMIV